MTSLIVAGLAFGDEGKGLTTDYLVRSSRSELVVRYNGGPQAAHNVVSPDGTHHTFSQFGSGTLAGARTFLSSFVLVDPLSLEVERTVLLDKVKALPPVIVDRKCSVILPYHILTNRIKERARGNGRHGSVGMGVGEARSDHIDGHFLSISDVLDLTQLKLEIVLREIYNYQIKKLQSEFGSAVSNEFHKSVIDSGLSASYIAGKLRGIVSSRNVIELASWKDVYYACGTDIVFEGAQGFLLDEKYGFPPFHTWSNCTFENAENLLQEVGTEDDSVKVGVFRTFFTRHGPGPFPTQDDNLKVHEKHNKTHDWMGGFRTGLFDMVLASFATKITGPDCLVVTHCDNRPSKSVVVRYDNEIECACNMYGYDVRSTEKTTLGMFAASPLEKTTVSDPDFLNFLSGSLDIPICFSSWGPSSKDVHAL